MATSDKLYKAKNEKMVDRVFFTIDKMNRSLANVGVILVFLIAALMCLNVIMRFLHIPEDWSLEVTKVCFTVMAFLLAGYVLARERHINMELVVDALNEKTRCILMSMGSIVGAIYCGVMAYYSWGMVNDSITFAEYSFSWPALPMAPVKVFAIIGFILFGLQFLASPSLPPSTVIFRIH